ncbi:MAG: DUF58 domain-containing protein [Acidimicrobiales bacterium]
MPTRWSPTSSPPYRCPTTGSDAPHTGRFRPGGLRRHRLCDRRLFGADELLILAAIQLAALVIAVLAAASTRLDLSISRTANPARLRAGTPARIDVAITNRARRSTPMLLAVDHISGTPGASLHLAPIKGGASAPIAYRLPTARRGLIDVGPLDLRFGDPLGLTRGSVRASDLITLVVHPELVDLGALHAIAGHDPTADQQPIRALATGGDEFFALRPYVIGDELRRVHWRASARMGDLVVRQDERPRTGRVTVLLDLRRSSYDEPGFERAVSAALSALYAGWRATTRPLHHHGQLGHQRHPLPSRARRHRRTVGHHHHHRVRLARAVHREPHEDGAGRHARRHHRPPHQRTPHALDRARRSFGVVTTVVCQPCDDPPADAIVFDGTTPLQHLWRQHQSNATAAPKAQVRR